MAAGLCVGLGLRELVRVRRLAAYRLKDLYRCGKHAGIVIALLEIGQHRILDDESGLRVGKLTLQPVTDFDARLVFVGRDDDKRAVALALLPDAPGAAELIAIIGDVGALQLFQRDDDDLIAGLLFVFGQKRRQLVLGVAR